MKIGVISDTHIPLRAKVLPGVIFHAFDGVDLILHAGDLVSPEVLDELATIAPVRAVRGNVDQPELVKELPLSLVLDIEGFRVGLTHGHGGKPGKTVERALEIFRDEQCDCMVFGHSHQPFKKNCNGVLLFNPGSPTDPRREPYPTLGVLRVHEKLDGRILQFEPESSMIIGELRGD